MGYGACYQCSNCGYEYTYRMGSSMGGFREYHKKMQDLSDQKQKLIEAGEYGEILKHILESSKAPDSKIHIRFESGDALLRCSNCHKIIILQRTRFSMWDRGAKNSEFELNVGFHDDRCPNCSSKMLHYCEKDDGPEICPQCSHRSFKWVDELFFD